jgi:hypothetical protein
MQARTVRLGSLAARMRCYLALTGVFFFSFAAIAKPLTPARAERLIDSIGPNAVAERIFASDEESERLLRGVAMGTEPWLRVVMKLAPALDAHPAEAVRTALGAALKRRPRRILSVGEHVFSVGGICGPPDVDDYEHLAPALAELRSRQAAVRAVHDKALVRQRETCLAHLATAEKHLRAFFVTQ